MFFFFFINKAKDFFIKESNENKKAKVANLDGFV